MIVDYISDVHIDSWLQTRAVFGNTEKRIKTFVELLLPENPGNVIIVAGDVSHTNLQSEMFLKELRLHYDHVIMVFGNHDHYLIGYDNIVFYEGFSQNRLNELKEHVGVIDGIHILCGDVVEIDGKMFGGSAGWYDGQYAVQVHKLSKAELYGEWLTRMNDKNFMLYNFSHIDFIEQSKKEYELIDSIASCCDVMVTHVAPNWKYVQPKYANPFSGFFSFDGRKIIRKMGKDAVWVFGHVHDPYEYTYYGRRMLCNPLGYCHDGNHFWESQLYIDRRIKQFEV